MVTGSALHRERGKGSDGSSPRTNPVAQRTGRTTRHALRSLDFGQELSKDAGRENRRGVDGHARHRYSVGARGGNGRGLLTIPSNPSERPRNGIDHYPLAGIKPGRRLSRLESLTQSIQWCVGRRSGRSPLPLWTVQDGAFSSFHPSARSYGLRSLDGKGIAHEGYHGHVSYHGHVRKHGVCGCTW